MSSQPISIPYDKNSKNSKDFINKIYYTDENDFKYKVNSHELSSGINFFDPSKNSPPNSWLKKLGERIERLERLEKIES